MPGYLRTDGDTRHVQPISLRDGVVNCLHEVLTASSSTSSQSCYRFGTHIQGPSSSTQSGYAGTRLPQIRLLALLGVCKRPWSPRGRGEVAMAVPCCHLFYGTVCAVGLTWRPLTGSLFLSSFWCRLKPGPSGERGRKSSLLQDMLVTRRPTCTTGGRSSRELTGNDPRTDRSLLTHKDGRPFLAGIPSCTQWY